MAVKYGSIIIYSVGHQPQSVQNLFCKKFMGQETSAQKGKYRYRRRGFLDYIPYHRFIRGVLLVRSKDSARVSRQIREFGGNVHVRKVVLTRRDIRDLGLDIA
ncbi:MAG: hypothetical protein FJ149_07925 [Euryarchaeota archaeon]|nr:hypothetical protein [Euryarchaeota archaeon]